MNIWLYYEKYAHKYRYKRYLIKNKIYFCIVCYRGYVMQKKFMEASNNMVIVENGTSNFDQRVSAFV